MFQIIGHEKIIQFLEKSIANEKLAHAYLFYGPAHVGKTAVAEYLAASLVCEKRLAGRGPCGECASCSQVLKRIHPDVTWISEAPGKEQIGINQIRALKESLILAPLCASYKIAIIERADNLTVQSANSFLKLLEEAPKKTIIVLIGQSLSRIPPTVRSRCQVLKFSFPKKTEIISYLVKNFALPQSRAARLLALTLGRPGLAIEFARTPEKIIEAEKEFEEILSLLVEDNLEYKFKLANLISDKLNLTDLSHLIRDLILVKLGLKPSDKLSEIMTKTVGIYSKERLVDFAFNILETQFLVSRNVNKKLAIENLLINF